MSATTTGQRIAAEVLGSAIAGLSIRRPDDEGIGGSDFVASENGVAATLYLPTGDRVRLSVEWLGDQEADA